MKNYSITSPSLDGVLSDDHMYFEGVRRPQAFFTVRDSEIADEKDMVILERYFNDTYNLFLRKLTTFASTDSTSPDESLKLQALLQELIKVKGLISREL